MPKRNLVFSNSEYYHLYNRTTGGITIFSGKKALKRSLGLIDYYRFPQKLRYSKYLDLSKEEKTNYEVSFRKKSPIIEIFSFALMPNHFHLLLRQTSDSGITKFISNFQNSYAKYFNKRSERSGGVYQGPFKAKHIDSNNYLLHLSRYIHLNPITSYIINLEKLDSYSWTSFPYYLTKQNNIHFVNTKFITNILGSRNRYKKFVHDQADYQKGLEKIRGLIID
ncbi:transposase [Patescibacteria group bacterium]